METSGIEGHEEDHTCTDEACPGCVDAVQAAIECDNSDGDQDWDHGFGDLIDHMHDAVAALHRLRRERWTDQHNDIANSWEAAKRLVQIATVVAAKIRQGRVIQDVFTEMSGVLVSNAGGLQVGTMPAGRYWVGDLCYVLRYEWDNLWGLPDGVHTLPDGRLVAKFSTIHGDGTYCDEEGREYAVDSGSLGCILAAGICTDDDHVGLGEFVTVAEPFTPGRVYPEGSSPRCDGGVLEMAGVRIHLDVANDD